MTSKREPSKKKAAAPGSRKRKAPGSRSSGGPQSLAPRTRKENPERNTRLRFLYYRSAGVVVNEDTAMSQSTVWACVRVISESLAGMPWLVGSMLDDGRTVEPIPKHPLNYLLNVQPNDETRAFSFRETLWSHALVWGNGYAEIERDYLGRPYALWQIHPSRVTPKRDPDTQELYYEVDNQGEKIPIPYWNMFHLMGPSPDGISGWPVIRWHHRTIGIAIAQEDNVASINANDSTPGGMLIHPGKLTDTARHNMEVSWQRQHQGPQNRRRIAVLEEGVKWEQTGMAPQDAQLVEQLQLTPAMICRIFRVPPHKVAAGIQNSSGDYNNNENQDIEFVKDTLRPWAERGESEADIKLFGRNQRGSLVTVIDMSERERGDTAAQSTHVKDMFDRAMYSVNDGLRYLGKPGIGPAGDKRFVPLNMQLLEKAGEEPEGPAEPGDSPEEDKQETESQAGDDRLSRFKKTGQRLLLDSCRRITNQAKDCQHLAGEARDKWLAKHRDYCRSTLMLSARLLADCHSMSDDALAIAVDVFIERHVAALAGSPEQKATEVQNLIYAASTIPQESLHGQDEGTSSTTETTTAAG